MSFFYFVVSVRQLVKNTKNNKVLDLHVLGQKMQSYEFVSLFERESFCQMVHHMKQLHSPVEELDSSLTLFIGTWNLGTCTLTLESRYTHSRI